MILYLTLFLTALDVFLTHYQFTMDKKLDIYDKRKELNWLPRLLIGDKPSHIRAIFHSILNIIIVGGCYYFIALFNYIEADRFLTMIFGVLFIVNVYHIHNIRIYWKNMYNVQFWNYTRQRRDIMK